MRYIFVTLYINISIIQKHINTPLILLKNCVNKCPNNLINTNIIKKVTLEIKKY